MSAMAKIVHDPQNTKRPRGLPARPFSCHVRRVNDGGTNGIEPPFRVGCKRPAAQIRRPAARVHIELWPERNGALRGVFLLHGRWPEHTRSHE